MIIKFYIPRREKPHHVANKGVDYLGVRPSPPRADTGHALGRLERPRRPHTPAVLVSPCVLTGRYPSEALATVHAIAPDNPALLARTVWVTVPLAEGPVCTGLLYLETLPSHSVGDPCLLRKGETDQHPTLSLVPRNHGILCKDTEVLENLL